MRNQTKEKMKTIEKIIAEYGIENPATKYGTEYVACLARNAAALARMTDAEYRTYRMPMQQQLAELLMDNGDAELAEEIASLMEGK